MSYQLIYNKEYKNIKTIQHGESLFEIADCKLDTSLKYKLRVRGEVAIPDNHRTEGIYPFYFRKIDESLISVGEEYVLSFDSSNKEHERTAYQMLRGDFQKGKSAEFSLKYKLNGTFKKFFVSLEVYYGEQKTRYYYEKPDQTFCLDLNATNDYFVVNQDITFSDNVDFIMLKISAIDFDGNAKVYAPKFLVEGTNYVCPYEYAPEKLSAQSWIGEGFSKTNQPTFELIINGQQIFKGRKLDRLHHFAGVEFVIPEGILKENDNEIVLRYGENNYNGYNIRNLQFITVPNKTEILAVAPYQIKDKPFGVLCYFENECDVEVCCDENIEYVGGKHYQQGMQVLPFIAKETGANVKVEMFDGVKKHTALIKNISEKIDDKVLTGTGDFIYINQNEDDFFEYLSWFLNENIGDMFTLRSCYRWGATAEADPIFWQKAIDVLKKLCIYYVLMIDGRELNGVNANPSLDILQGEYFLGEQTHERDGAFTYWTQNIDDYDAFFYHLLSRKLERSGIYGKHSPVYDKKKQARIYYADDNISNVKDAYEELLKNLKRTAAQGATRHTGVTPLFDVFLKAGYKWVGYESMYGSHEVILGALRGMSNSIGQNLFGTHLALQWSTVPSDDFGHALRYRLSLYLSYMHGVSHVNTEEGLWNIETPFADNDRYSYACTIHREEQKKFNSFIKTHTRAGKQVRNIAMMVGKYDGMDCFSTGKVYGQSGESWKYNSPEKSWDLLKVFYPQAKLGALYYFIKKDGAENLKTNEEIYLMAGIEGKDTAKYYQSFGYYSETPYGVIDIIASDAKNLNEYKAIFFTGWNTCDIAQLNRLYEYVKNGGVLMLGKSHLYDSISREEVFSGKATIIDSPIVKKLLSHKNVCYFDNDGYPADYENDYTDRLNELGKRFASKFISNTKYVSFTEYLKDDNSTTLYLLDINWWNDESATCTLNLAKDKYELEFNEKNIHVIYVSPNGNKAIMTGNCETDVVWVSDDQYKLLGNQSIEYVLFENGQAKIIKSK